jgi:hypothetical protein
MEVGEGEGSVEFHGAGKGAVDGMGMGTAMGVGPVALVLAVDGADLGTRVGAVTVEGGGDGAGGGPVEVEVVGQFAGEEEGAVASGGGIEVELAGEEWGAVAGSGETNVAVESAGESAHAKELPVSDLCIKRQVLRYLDSVNQQVSRGYSSYERALANSEPQGGISCGDSCRGG